MIYFLPTRKVHRLIVRLYNKKNLNRMKTILLMAAVVLLSSTAGKSQIKNVKTETVKVYGNCSICKIAIEKAANKKNLSKADWNKDTKMAAITYDSKKTNIDAVLKNIALYGYDNDKYLAPDEAYAKLQVCCKYERKNKALVKTVISELVKDSIRTGGDVTGHNNGNAVTENQQNNQLKPVFDTYFALKDALVKTDGVTAAAKAMLEALNAVKMESLKMDEHMVWMKVEKELKTDVQNISSKKDAALQRDIFVKVSEDMYDLIKVAKLAETVYYQHCPMYNDGKGANWLSKENTIKNPYYGSQMLTCGKTVETIKQ
jgi:Protein of unknown function (DUF3347)